MKKFFFLLIVSAVALSATAQDSTFARDIIRQLSSPEFHGRGHEFHGDSIAAEYLRNKMREIGLQPLADDYFQHYSYTTYAVEKEVRLAINKQKLVPYQDFRVTYLNRIKDLEVHNPFAVKNGIWLVGVDKLDTYSPLSTVLRAGVADPKRGIAIEVLNTKLPKRVRKIDVDLDLNVHTPHQTQNVMGFIPGENDSMIVFCGHYDHCGSMGPDIYFPGAHDNASGCAAVLDIARRFASTKPHYTMVFMLFSGEESGLKGSEYASKHPPIDFAKVKLLCNIDMFCGGDDGIMVVNSQSETTRWFLDQLNAANNQMNLTKEVKSRPNAANSDHYWFSKICPAVFIYTLGGRHGDYHSPTDTCESCGLGHYNDIVTLILKSLQ
ncbi:MAG: M28 family peptidase [Bacteroidales bacterium]|nr:M28 family peptidase [Bacteroidales bacterium]